MVKQRESNIELLRFIVMAFIVLHHFIFHGLGLFRYLAFNEPAVLNPSQIDYALIFDSFLIAAVDVFVLISGYFSIKFTASGFVKLFSIVSFFAMIGFCCYLYNNTLQGGIIGSLLRVAQRGLFVISNKTYWFIQYYFILMLLSGPINKYVEVSSRKSLLSTIGLLLFINVYLGWIQKVDFVTDGYNLLNFVMLYLIGRYLKLHYKKQITKKWDAVIYILCSFATAATAIILYHNGWDAYRAFCYNSPFVLMSAIAIFMFFAKIHFTSSVVNYLASSCLAIYLMQEGGIHCYNQIKDLYLQNGFNISFWIMIGIFFCLSMTIPLIVDKMRVFIFGKAESKVAGMIDRLIFKKYIE